jgi:hypothetical protein
LSFCFRRLLVAVVMSGAATGLAACASDPGSSRALQWIQESEAEKQRLNDAGFPQFVGPA